MDLTSKLGKRARGILTVRMVCEQVGQSATRKFNTAVPTGQACPSQGLSSSLRIHGCSHFVRSITSQGM